MNVALAGYTWLTSIAIIISGVLSHKHGVKHVAGYCQLVASFISFFIPFSADYGPIVVACVRAIQGFFTVPNSRNYYRSVGSMIV